MTALWEVKPLGEICEVLDSFRRPITKRDRVPGPYPYYGATGVLDYVDGFLFDEPLVLIGEDGAKWGPSDKSAFATSGPVWVNNHAHVLRPKRHKIEDAWLIYYLNATDLMPFISGMTVPKLNQGSLREIPIPVPTLEEQRKIIAVLDDASTGLTRAQENIKMNMRDAEVLHATTLEREMTGESDWREVPLHSLGPIKTGATPKSVNGDRSGAFMPFIRPGDFRPDGSLVEDGEWLSEASAKESRVVPGGTVLMVCIGATIGKVASTQRPICFNQQINALTPTVEASAEFLTLQMQTERFQARVKGGAGQATLPILNKSKWSTLKVSLPPKRTTQDQITERLHALREDLDALKEQHRRCVDDLDALRQSLFTKAFSGELT